MKKILLLSTSLFFFAENIFPQSQGPNSPGSASYSAIGCLSCPGNEWNNYFNILVPDGQNGDVQLSPYPMCFQTTCYYSRYLMAQNFGFTIPVTASIDGITAEIICRSGAGWVTDTIVKLLSFNLPAGNNNSPGSFPWLPTTSVILYGDTNDLWGLGLTPDSVNDPDFGIAMMVRNISTSPDTAFVDHVQMTVYYSLPTGTFSQTRIPGNTNVYYSQEENTLTLSEDALHNTNRISVTDITGREIYSFISSAGQQKFFLPVLSNGIYFAIIDTKEKSIAKKFAVNK